MPVLLQTLDTGVRFQLKPAFYSTSFLEYLHVTSRSVIHGVTRLGNPTRSVPEGPFVGKYRRELSATYAGGGQLCSRSAAETW